MATSSSLSTVPSDHHAPLAVVDADNHGAWVLICNSFGLTVVLITLIIRIYVRVKVSPPFAADDYTLAAATTFTVIQVCVVFSQVHAGFGRSIDLIEDRELVDVQKLGYAADILFIAGLYASKCCVVLFFKRITASRASAIFAWTVFVGCLASLVASTFVVSLRCDLSHPWLWYGEPCGSLITHWRAVAALDVATEALLFAMSLHLVWDLQTSIVRKAKVVFAFALRLLVILVAGIRLQHVERQIESSNPTLTGATAAILAQIELFYSIVAATVPCLRPFLAAFVTNYGAMGGDTIMHGSHIGNSQAKDTKGSGSTSFALQSLDAAKRAIGRHEDDSELLKSHDPPDDSNQIFRPDPVANRASAVHGKTYRTSQGAASVGSDESTRGMVIKKEVAWQVENESMRTRSIPDG